jgi:hypothetical protein
MSTPSLDFPEFTISFFNNLPIEYFNSSLKLVNRDWYKECKRELITRRNLSHKKLMQSINEMEELDYRIEKWFLLPNQLTISRIDHPEFNKLMQLVDITYNDFNILEQVDKAIIRCGFSDIQKVR